MASIRPSTDAGTPLSISAGAEPIPVGQFARTSSWFPPIPPLATMTAGARTSKEPIVSRLLAAPRSASSGASTEPCTPTTAPFSTSREST
jgi:hypothetical protein